MIDAPFALAFTAGMVATVNPCGFAMLPAYLSFFVGVEHGGGENDARGNVSRALVVGGAVAAGFAATFAVIGFVVSHLSTEAYRVAPWLSLVIGAALVLFGIALLGGAHPLVRLPRLDKGGRTTSLGSMFVFGVSYAIASLGCTLPLFLSYASTLFGRSLFSGAAYFVAYALGFAIVLIALTVSLALATQGVVRNLRRVLPYVDRIAGGLLVLTGLYVVWYGLYEIRTLDTPRQDDVVDRVTGWSSDISNWVSRTGGVRIGLILALVVAAAGVYAATRSGRARRRAASTR
jgi:cytochrome c biogenesis protein CcdA